MIWNIIEYTESHWRNLQMDNLKVDEAFVQVNSSSDSTIWLYYLSSECIQCPFSFLKKIAAYRSNTIKVDVTKPIALKMFDVNHGPYAFGNSTSMCTLNPDLGEFGVYNLTINANKTCNFVTDKEPVNVNLSLISVAVLIVLLSLLYKLSTYLYQKYVTGSVREANEESEVQIPAKKRLKSLDLFRGMAIVLMIFVNSGGGKYWWIEHAPWNGLHLADIVFPSFLWIMGVCIPISIKSQLNRSIPKRTIIKTIFVRALKLFLIGVCLNSINGPQLSQLRIMGVLQRFGICYFLCAFTHLIFTNQHSIIPQSNFQRIFLDIITMKKELIISLCLILINLVVIFGVEKPGCPRGYLGPGGKHKDVSAFKCIGGIIGYIDEEILGHDHIYQNPSAKSIYNSTAFDPEGLFGCLLSTVQVFLGVQCGIILAVFTQWQARAKRLLFWGLGLGIIANILCMSSIEDGPIPINKNLWSLSFVFITSAICFIMLLICYMIVDVKSWWNGYPFVQSGMNAIIMYIGHSIMHKMLPWHWRIGLMNTHFILLIESIWNTVVWIIISIILYNRKIFYNL